MVHLSFNQSVMQIRGAITIILSTTLASLAFSQFSDYPVIETYDFQRELNFNDESRKVKFHDNGNTKREYIKQNDSIWMRTDYYPNGNPKIAAEVREFIRIDTLMEYDEEGNGRIAIQSSVVEILFGYYTEYYNTARIDPSLSIKCQGQNSDEIKIGKWLVFDRQRNKTEINFNKNGIPTGNYREYYYDRSSKDYKVKVSGQYGPVKYRATGFDYETYQEIPIEKTRSEKVGTWTYYNIKGDKVGKVSYKWRKIGRR